MDHFVITEQTPVAALTVGQFKSLFKEVTSTSTPTQGDDIPEIFGKKECAEITGYTINTINVFISKRKIPYYKNFGRVFFKKSEILDWLLSRRVETTREFCERKDAELLAKKGGHK